MMVTLEENYISSFNLIFGYFGYESKTNAHSCKLTRRHGKSPKYLRN